MGKLSETLPLFEKIDVILFSIMVLSPSCQTCGKQFEPEGGADPDRLPLVFDCMCVFCRGCAAQHEAEHVSSIDSNGSGGGGGESVYMVAYDGKPVLVSI